MLGNIVKREYFTDRTILLLSGGAIAIALFIILRVLLGVQQFNDKVAVRYTQYGIEQFERGNWFTSWDMAFFALVTTIAALFIAMRLHASKRPISLTVLSLQIITMIFLVLVSHAILSLSPATS